MCFSVCGADGSCVRGGGLDMMRLAAVRVCGGGYVQNVQGSGAEVCVVYQ